MLGVADGWKRVFGLYVENIESELRSSALHHVTNCYRNMYLAKLDISKCVRTGGD